MTAVPDTDRLASIEQKLDELIERGNGVGQRWLSVKTAAKYADVAEKSIRGLIAAAKLTPHRPLRGKVLVDRHELDNLIATATSRPRTSRGNGDGTVTARKLRVEKTDT